MSITFWKVTTWWNVLLITPRLLGQRYQEHWRMYLVTVGTNSLSCKIWWQMKSWVFVLAADVKYTYKFPSLTASAHITAVNSQRNWTSEHREFAVPSWWTTRSVANSATTRIAEMADYRSLTALERLKYHVTANWRSVWIMDYCGWLCFCSKASAFTWCLFGGKDWYWRNVPLREQLPVSGVYSFDIEIDMSEGQETFVSISLQ